jgi:hypothetical protein
LQEVSPLAQRVPQNKDRALCREPVEDLKQIRIDSQSPWNDVREGGGFESEEASGLFLSDSTADFSRGNLFLHITAFYYRTLSEGFQCFSSRRTASVFNNVICLELTIPHLDALT